LKDEKRTVPEPGIFPSPERFFLIFNGNKIAENENQFPLRKYAGL
jgi:hypothetical protein